jgi:hypothetical protein
MDHRKLATVIELVGRDSDTRLLREEGERGPDRRGAESHSFA